MLRAAFLVSTFAVFVLDIEPAAAQLTFIEELRARIVETVGGEVVQEPDGQLVAGSTDIFSAFLNAGGNYVIVVFCDQNCAEIGIEAVGGGASASASGPGLAELGLQPTGNAAWDMTVSMTGCSGSCSWGGLVISRAVTP